MTSKLEIVVLTCYFGGLDFEHLQCMRGILSANSEELKIHGMQLPGCPWLDIGMAYLTDQALEQYPTADVLFWIEHDMIFNPEDVVKMSKNLLDSDYDMLGAAYSMRVPKGRIVAGIKGTHQFYQPGLTDATQLGFGFTAIKPSTIYKMRETVKPIYCPTFDRPIHPYFAHLMDDAYHGQDTSFCIRLERIGGKMGVDLEPRVFHKGSYKYALEDTGIEVPRYQTLTVNLESL